jgi:hypothetical protein
VCVCDLGHLRVRVCGPRCHSGSSLHIYRVYLRYHLLILCIISLRSSSFLSLAPSCCNLQRYLQVPCRGCI